MKDFIIRKLGGFTKDEIEKLKEQLEDSYPDLDTALRVVNHHKDKHKILTEAVKHHFNTIDEEDILQEKGRDWLIAGKVLPEEQTKLLISEAQIFLKTRLWKVLQTDIKYQLNKRMFIRSKDENDLIAGKIGLFILDALRTRLNSLDKESGKFNKTA